MGTTSNCTQKKYFPIDQTKENSGHPINDVANAKINKNNITSSIYEEENATDQIDAFDDFFTFIESDPHFKQNSSENVQKVIAFLIEAIKQLYRDDWKNELSEIKNKITGIRNHSDPSDPDLSYKKTTWLLSDIFLNLYEKSVAINALKASRENDPSGEKFYTRLFKNIQNLHKLGNSEVSSQHPIPLGGVHETFIPCWLKEYQTRNHK